MPDLRFYSKNSDFKLTDICDLVLNFDEIKDDISVTPHDIATLMAAEPNDISFYHNARYRQIVEQSQARFILCSRSNVDHIPEHAVPIVVSSPQRAYAIVAQKMYLDPENQTFIGNNNDEFLTRLIDKNIVVEPGVVIEDSVEIGHNTRIGANTVIRSGVSIGSNCRIGANCVISHSLIGNAVTVFPGAKVGQAGFGFVMDDQGHITIPQLGRVIIEDKVEIGANTTIDRGTLDDTIIGYGTRIDNLVQIGHGVQIGQHCVIVALVGISGSTKLGDRVIAAGQVGIAGHLTIGSDAIIAAKSGVSRDVLPGQKIGGIPGMPLDQWHRQTAILKKMLR